MLLKFTVENYLSFKNKATIDFAAGSIKEYTDNVYSTSFANTSGVLKSIGIFGHNASGKSNMIKAISFVRDLALNSSKENASSREIPFEPFRLSVESAQLPSSFEIVFVLNNTRYRYGFSLTSTNIESEWLFKTEKRKEENLYVRAKQNFSFEKNFKNSLKGKLELVYEMTRTNSLFLSVLSQFNYTLCLEISNWFSKIIIAHDTEHATLIDFTAKLLSMGEYRKLINDVIKKSDLGIDSVEERLKESAVRNNLSYDFISSVFTDDMRQFSVRTSHAIFKNEKIHDKVFFDLLKNESLGTQKFFGVLGPLLYTIKEKGIILIDEIDARMHSLLVLDVISLFNSKKTNSNGAQLIFTSHNTNILKKGLRRDQMIFVEKDKFGVSTMQSLYSKDPKIRKDASFDKDYLSGKYGAIPGLGSQLNLFESL